MIYAAQYRTQNYCQTADASQLSSDTTSKVSFPTLIRTFTKPSIFRHYYCKICNAHKFKQARVGVRDITR